MIVVVAAVAIVIVVIINYFAWKLSIGIAL